MFCQRGLPAFMPLALRLARCWVDYNRFAIFFVVHKFKESGDALPRMTAYGNFGAKATGKRNI